MFGLFVALVYGQYQTSITLPSDGTVVKPGDSVTFQIAVGPDSPSGVALMAPGLTQAVAGPPYTATVVIPRLPAGPWSVVAARDTSDGKTHWATARTLWVEPASPASIAATPKTMTLQFVGAAERFFVTGTWADGTRAPIEAAKGTLLTPDDPSVAIATSDQQIQAVGPGFTVVHVQNGTAQDSIRVRVERLCAATSTATAWWINLTSISCRLPSRRALLPPSSPLTRGT